MAIESMCRGCGRRLRVADEYAGQQARCPICSTVYTVGAGAAPGSEPERAAVQAGANSSTASSNPSSTGAWRMLTPEGRTYGPVDKPELDAWLQEGRISADCQLSFRGGAWAPAGVTYPSLQASSPKQRTSTGFTSPPGSRAAAPYSATAAGYAPPNSPFTEQAYAGYPPAGATAPGNYALPWSGAAPYGGPVMGPYSSSTWRPGQLAHRGGLILGLGIGGVALGLSFGCPVLSIMAWVMGTADLSAIRAGRMDSGGEGLTRAGQILGMVFSLLWIGGCVLLVLMMILTA